MEIRVLLCVQSVLKKFQKLVDSQHHLEKFDSSNYLMFQSEKLTLVSLRWLRYSLLLCEVRL